MKLVGEVINFNKFSDRIKEAAKAATDLRPAFVSIENDWYKDNKQIFNMESEGQYPDLSPDYAEQKENDVGFIYPILKRSGRLELSITDPTHMDAVHEMSKTTLVLGSQTPYGIYHQSSAPRKKIPYRPFIFNQGVTGGFANIFQSRMKRYTRIIEVYIKRQLSKFSKGY